MGCTVSSYPGPFSRSVVSGQRSAFRMATQKARAAVLLAAFVAERQRRMCSPPTTARDMLVNSFVFCGITH